MEERVSFYNPMSALDPDRWEALSPYLDEALSFSGDERSAWLAALRARDPLLAAELQKLLEEHRELDDQGFLQHGARRLAGVTPGDSATSLDPLLGRVLSHYRLEQRLGAGGMGVLYRAIDLKLERAVALKLLARHLLGDEEAKARFVREARAASALDHPNIATIHEIGEDGGELFIAMALYEGQTLKHRCEQGPLTIDETIDVLRQILLGLQAAHRAGIVHRDIKPANIFFTQTGVLKILDFGLAKLLRDSQAQTMTQTGRALGTVLYMSPEQLRGETVDSRTDLWSLGVVAHELLTGVSPFRADSGSATALRILNDEPPSLASIPQVPAWLGQFISQLLRKDPAERPQTAGDVLQQLEEQKMVRSAGRSGLAATIRRWGPGRIALAIAGAIALAVAWNFRDKFRSQEPTAGRSLAVLPFANLSASEEDAYFAQGFHSELLRQMGLIQDLRVISQTSVLQYKQATRNLREIADALGVSSVVEGSVQRAGNRIRVEARLIDARSDRQLWADRYDREASDIFAIQTALAEEIAGALRVRLSGTQRAHLARKPTQSTEAYDLYLRGLQYSRQIGCPNLEFSEPLLRKAIELDASFALARARLAAAKFRSYWCHTTTDIEAEDARREAEQSLRLQPDLPEGHFALGLYHYYVRGDYEPAVRELELARAGGESEPLVAIATLRWRQGRIDEALRNAEQAVQLDPTSPQILITWAQLMMCTRRYEQADQVLNRILLIAPDSFNTSIFKAHWREQWKGETEPAKNILRQARGNRYNGRLLFHSYAGFKWPTRYPREAIALVDAIEAEWIEGMWSAQVPKSLFYAMSHQALADTERARREYEAALPLLEEKVDELRRTPRSGTSSTRATHNAWQLIYLGRAYLGLGRKEESLQAMRRAVEVAPISKDAAAGRVIELELAAVEAHVGQTEAALERIRRIVSMPCGAEPAELRLDPIWAPLRDDPRFRQLANL